MEDSDVVLSEIHVNASQHEIAILNYRSSTANHEIKIAVTRFQFKLPTTNGHQTLDVEDNNDETNLTYMYDEDGDIDVKRNSDGETGVIIIEHGLAAPLSLVGLQIWPGALILCDYLLHISSQLYNKILLELGAGSGLSSIIASRYANLTICTDTRDEVLEMCQTNINRNTPLNKVIVRDLDWCAVNPYQDSSSKWSWALSDLEALNKVDLIIAADVIYSNSLTDDFIKVLKPLLLVDRPVTAFISLEKRLNFTLEQLEVCCPAYDHFIEWIQKLANDMPKLFVSKVPNNFPQRFEYNRTKYLEIWNLSNTAALNLS